MCRCQVQTHASHHRREQHRVKVYWNLLQQAQDNPTFKSRIFTGDESWVYGYGPETKQQSSKWKTPTSPRPKKAGWVRSATKSMLVVYFRQFDIRGVMNRKSMPQGQTVNAAFCCTVLRRLRENTRRKLPELWCNGNWLLQQDNAPAHSALKIRQYLGCTSTLL